MACMPPFQDSDKAIEGDRCPAKREEKAVAASRSVNHQETEIGWVVVEVEKSEAKS